MDSDSDKEFHINNSQLRAHLEFCKQWQNNRDKNKPVYIALSDSGADATIVGKGARIFYKTGNTATIVGYDPNTTITKAVPIVSAAI